MKFLRKLCFWKKQKPQEPPMDKFGKCDGCGSCWGEPTWFQNENKKWWKYLCPKCVQAYRDSCRHLHEYIIKTYGDKLRR